MLLTVGLVLSPGAAARAQPHPGTVELDHVLLWGRTLDQVSAIMAVKLGFRVRPGRDPGGVANRYVRMSDRSYLELEGITRSKPQLDPGMRADQAVLHGGPGARTFGLRSPALDRTRASLQERGFTPTEIFSASPTDPDGAGPSAPPRWRLFAFEKPPLSSSLFFIDYAAATVVSTHEHPNGARELSALWLLSSNAESDRKQLEKMGFTGATAVRIPQVSARGYSVPVGRKRILVLQPEGAGIAADALRSGGPQVFGISVGVADLDRAKKQVERGYERTLTDYPGLLGRSFLAPTQEDLGLLIEFHALSGDAAVK